MEDVSRNLQDVLHHCSTEEISGALVSIDFSKAFDKISHIHILKTLKEKGFGPLFTNMIGDLLYQIKSRISINGDTSTIFDIQRSCRQGDPIAPLLFILATDTLNDVINKTKSIKGVKIGNKSKTNDSFADDVTFCLTGNQKELTNSIRKIYEILNNFKATSGLKINSEKTKIIKIGTWNNNHKTLPFNTVESLTILGSPISPSQTDIDGEIQKEILERIEDGMKFYKKLTLNPIEKSYIWNSLIVSKIIHLMRQSPFNPETCSQINEKRKLFFWGEKRPSISISRLESRSKDGGFGLINTETLWRAMNLDWIRRLPKSDELWAYNIKRAYKECYKIEVEEDIDRGPDRLISTLKQTSPFWKGIAEAIRPICNGLLLQMQGEMPVRSNKLTQANGENAFSTNPKI